MECSLNECGICASKSVVAFCENCNFGMCEHCFQMHKRSTKAFQNHVAFLIETIKSTLDQSILGDNVRDVSKHNSGDIHTHKCATHTTENLIFFCSDHTDTLCGRCVVSCHKLCKVVDLFEVEIDEKEVTACKSHLKDLAEKLKLAANKIDQNTADNKSCKQDFLKELQQLRTDVNTWFDCLQSKYETHCSETFETNAEHLTNVGTFCNELKKRIAEHQELIDNLLTQNHVKRLYVLLHKVKQETVEISSKLNGLEIESSFKEYCFKRSSGIQKLLNDKTFDIGGLEESVSGSDEISEGSLSSITGNELLEQRAKKLLASSVGNEVSPEELKEQDHCFVCSFWMEKITQPKKQLCGHLLCRHCIDALSLSFEQSCPTCGRVCGKITGDQPPGKMTVKLLNAYCTGYETVGKISIRYEFLGGQQLATHPSPGKAFTGISRTAFLPDNEKGRNICRMLKVAFERKLVFTIGNSRTTGYWGLITWNDIHHKTDYRPHSQFGYPDPTYLDRVTDELKAKGVTLDDINTTDNLEGIITTY